MAKWVSLIVKFGALVFIIVRAAAICDLAAAARRHLDHPDAAGGACSALYTRWFNDWALLVGWAVGIALGTWMLVAVNSPNYPLMVGGFTFPGYAAFYTVVLNLVIAIVLTPVFNAMRGGPAPVDATAAADYRA